MTFKKIIHLSLDVVDGHLLVLSSHDTFVPHAHATTRFTGLNALHIAVHCRQVDDVVMMMMMTSSGQHRLSILTRLVKTCGNR